MIVKGFPKGGQRGVKPAMTGVALGFAVIAYLVPGVSSAADPDKMGATIGSMRYLCPFAPAVRHDARKFIVTWDSEASSGGRIIRKVARSAAAAKCGR